MYDELDVNAAKTVPVSDLAAHLRSRGVKDNDYIEVCTSFFFIFRHRECDD